MYLFKYLSLLTAENRRNQIVLSISLDQLYVFKVRNVLRYIHVSFYQFQLQTCETMNRRHQCRKKKIHKKKSIRQKIVYTVGPESGFYPLSLSLLKRFRCVNCCCRSCYSPFTQHEKNVLNFLLSTVHQE